MSLFEKSSAKTFLNRSLQDVHSARWLWGELCVCAVLNVTRHPERSEAESNFFRLRSQTSLRSVCSSLRSEFDCAQDDVDEKSAKRSKAGSTNNQRTMYAEAQMESFGQAFSKACGVKRGRAPEKTALFFLRSFFFCAYGVKRKSERMTFYVVMTQRTMYAEAYFSCHPERSEAESNFFRLRSQTSLRSVCSSLRSEFDCAQDDVDEKSAERSKAGSTNN